MRNRFPRNCRIQLGSLENVVLLTGDRKFESISLQRRVLCEPLFNARQTGLDRRFRRSWRCLPAIARGSMGELAVAYQTAWTMAHTLRHGLSEAPTIRCAASSRRTRPSSAAGAIRRVPDAARRTLTRAL
jgi:hypothetical protein